ncbi:MAG TPA: DUF998 domain-containing protein [Myxococcales bacterium]|nr:DUF998 domain-containing protein [Myxococcales bacterium]
MPRKLLLACGVLASLLYVGIDVLAAIRYPGYHSFTSRVVSELMARGAPTERLVDPLFLLYGALMMAFAAGIWSSSDRLRVHVTGGLLFAYAAVGLFGPTLFEMNVRGAAGPKSDVLHIALTGALTLLIVAAVMAGAATWGRRFRLYSLATLLIFVVFGALISFASRGLAAGEPTPWLGLLERVDIGAFLLWVAVLSASLLGAPQRPSQRRGTPRRITALRGAPAR